MLSVLTKAEKEAQATAAASATDTEGETSQSLKGIHILLITLCRLLNADAMYLLAVVYEKL